MRIHFIANFDASSERWRVEHMNWIWNLLHKFVPNFLNVFWFWLFHLMSIWLYIRVNNDGSLLDWYSFNRLNRHPGHEWIWQCESIQWLLLCIILVNRKNHIALTYERVKLWLLIVLWFVSRWLIFKKCLNYF